MYIHINGIIKHGLLMRAVCFPYLLRWLSQRCLTTILRTGTFQPCLTTPEVLKGDMYHNGSWIIMDHNGSLSCIIYIYMIQLFVCHLGIFGASYEPLFMGFTIIPKRRPGVPRMVFQSARHRHAKDRDARLSHLCQGGRGNGEAQRCRSHRSRGGFTGSSFVDSFFLILWVKFLAPNLDSWIIGISTTSPWKSEGFLLQ